MPIDFLEDEDLFDLNSGMLEYTQTQDQEKFYDLADRIALKYQDSEKAKEVHNLVNTFKQRFDTLLEEKKLFGDTAKVPTFDDLLQLQKILQDTIEE